MSEVLFCILIALTILDSIPQKASEVPFEIRPQTSLITPDPSLEYTKRQLNGAEVWRVRWQELDDEASYLDSFLDTSIEVNV